MGYFAFIIWSLIVRIEARKVSESFSSAGWGAWAAVLAQGAGARRPSDGGPLALRLSKAASKA